MAPRAWSHVAEPHRVLKPSANPMRGEDVRALQGAAVRRLAARGIERHLTLDGECGKTTLEVLDTAAYFLGAMPSTTRPTAFPVGAQLMIRYPGRRTPAQLSRAGDRLNTLRLEREEQARKHAQDDGGVSGLTAAQRSQARDRAVAAMRLGLQNSYAIHYTQLAARWSGINQDLRSASGQFPRYADCSSLTTWALWNGLTGVGGLGFPDIVNGCRWMAGYTGTQVLHGKPVWAPNLLPGDLLFYGQPIGHVAMYVGDGRAISHGSEAGPLDVPYAYRPVAAARRYI